MTDTKQSTIETLAGGEAIENITSRVYYRISTALTDADIERLAKLDVSDISGKSSEDFILSRVPNLFEIIKEETEKKSKHE